MRKALKYAAFLPAAAAIIAMAVATVLEKTSGSEAAFRLVYHSPWLMALAGISVAAGLILLLRKPYRRKGFTLLLHLAFCLILAGALVTHFSAVEGQIHLRVGENGDTMETASEEAFPLPFSVSLESFRVYRHTASEAASDYESILLVRQDGMERRLRVAMNHIGRFRSWRFCQADCDPDGRGSVLSVSHDPAGIALTYTAYALLLLALLGFFFQKDTAWRQALARLSRAASLGIVFVGTLLGADRLRAADPPHAVPPVPEQERVEVPTGSPRTLPAPVAERFGRLYVYWNDRVAPMQTLCRECCLKAYGKPGWEGLSAEQVVTGWLFFREDWQEVPLRVKKKDRGTVREREKEDIRDDIASLLRIFPLKDSSVVRWYSREDELPLWVYREYETWVFVRKVLGLVGESVRAQQWDEVMHLLDRIGAWQEKAADRLPSPARIRAERLYNRIARPMIPFMACLLLGLLLFPVGARCLSRGRPFPRSLARVGNIAAVLTCLYLTLVLALYGFVSGHLPLTGTYCMMMLMGWIACLAIPVLSRRLPWIVSPGLLVAGFALLLAHITGSNPRITHLMPVLQSPLLSIHVLCMMLSYTLFGLVAVNAVLALTAGRDAERERLRDVGQVILLPAVFLLTAGTFIGAVWANISWGTYWSWDPKETWALITLLIYAFALHGRTLRIFRRPVFFHLYCIVAFAAVLFTWFGVNLILGGMHAYA